MKIRVAHSESIQVSEVHWIKDELDVEINTEFDGQFPEPDIKSSIENNSNKLREQLKEIVQKWHSNGVAQPNYNGQPLTTQTTQPTVIDRSIERLEIIIDDCKTKEELNEIGIKNGATIDKTPSLISLFTKKQQELYKT